MSADQPQSQFDDLYTAVYALIDDAKTRHRVIKLYKGSHGSSDPRPIELDYSQFFAAHRRGVLGFVCDRVRPGADHYRVADLDEYDRFARPRVPTRAVFDLLARTGRRTGETNDQYLTHVATRRHHLGAYRGGSSGLDDESRAFVAAYFQRLGIVSTAAISDSSISCARRTWSTTRWPPLDPPVWRAHENSWPRPVGS